MADQPARSHGWQIATVGGVPVYLSRSWPLIVVFVVVTFAPTLGGGRSLGYQITMALAYALLLLVSVLAHEAAHAATARWFGLQVDRVVADLWGGHTVYQSEQTTPRSSAAIALAGPVANGALGALGYLGWQASTGERTQLILFALMVTNMFVAAFNLLPGLPLDGGYLVEALVWGATGDRNRGLVVAGWLGRIVTITVGAWFVVWPLAHGDRPDFVSIIWVAFVGAFLWSGATQAIRAGQVRGRLAKVTVGSVISPTVTAAYAGSVASAVAIAARLGGPGFVVALDPVGRPVGLVDPGAVNAVPSERQDTTPLSAVVVGQPATWVVTTTPDADVTSVVEVMQSTRLPVVVAVDPTGRVLGAVSAETLNEAFGA